MRQVISHGPQLHAISGVCNLKASEILELWKRVDFVIALWVRDNIVSCDFALGTLYNSSLDASFTKFWIEVSAFLQSTDNATRTFAVWLHW